MSDADSAPASPASDDLRTHSVGSSGPGTPAAHENDSGREDAQCAKPDAGPNPAIGAGASGGGTAQQDLRDAAATGAENPAQAPAGQEPPHADQGSLSTTVTGTATHSRHRRDKTASDGAHSASTGMPARAPAPAARRGGAKRTLMATLLRALTRCLPCVGAPARDPAAAADDAGSAGSDPSLAAGALREKQGLLEKDRDAQESVAPPEAPLAAPSPSASTVLAPLTVVLTPAPADIEIDADSDADVVIAPVPTKHILPEAETAGVTSGAVQPPGSTADEQQYDDAADDAYVIGQFLDADAAERHQDAERARLIRDGGAGIPVGPDGVPCPLLPPIAPAHAGRKCLVLDLDETLVHNSFQPVHHADYVVPVEIEYSWHNVYILKRPGVDSFLRRMGELYEVVVFTASLGNYAHPVLDQLDVHQVVAHRLFRESCYHHKGNYVKDLSQLGRPAAATLILDNSPASYIFQPHNAVPVTSWFNDPHDTELTDLCAFLADLSDVDDVRAVLDRDA